MVTVQLCYGDFTAVISAESDPHPDLLNELVARCKALFLETQSALPDDD